MANRGGCCLWFNLVISVFGLLGGASAFVVFFFHFENRQAGIWAVVAATLSGICLWLHILYMRRTMETWYTPENLVQIRFLGILGLVAGLTGMAAYLGLAISNKEPFPTNASISGSHYIMAIWAMLTFKWGLSLVGFAHHYRKRMVQEYQPLLA